MRARSLLFVCWGMFVVPTAPAAITCLGSLEADSCSSVLNGITAFSSEAGYSFTRSDCERILYPFLNLADTDGLNDVAPVRAYLISDTTLTNLLDFVVVSELPVLYPNQDYFRSVLSRRYGHHEVLGTTTHFSSPRNPAATAHLYLATAKDHALLSPSHEALLWVLQHPMPPQKDLPEGTTARLHLPPETVLRLPAIDSLSPAVKALLATSLDSCLADISLRHASASLTLTLKPKSTAATTLLSAFVAHPAPCTDRIPEDSLLSVFLPTVPNVTTQAPSAFLLIDHPALQEKSLSLTLTRDRSGFRLVEFARAANPAAADAMIAKLDHAVWDEAVELIPLKDRMRAKTTIRRFTFKLLPMKTQKISDASIVSYLRMALPLLKKATLEIAREHDLVTLVIAPSASADAEMDSLAALPTAKTPLDQRITATLPGFHDCQPFLGVEGSAIAILRQLVSIMPGARPEHLRLFPVNIPRAHLGLGLTPGKSLRASLSIPSDEIAAFRRISTDGQETFHELLFLFMSIQLREMSSH